MGFTLRCFQRLSLPYWEYKATNSLRSADVSAWYEGITDGVTAEQLDAIEYVG